jgi:hypothetical protein
VRNQSDIAAAGFADLLATPEPPPPLSAAAALALRCWHWCRGWAPERWPLWGALHPVPDWDLHLILLDTIAHACDTADRQSTTPSP